MLQNTPFLYVENPSKRGTSNDSSGRNVTMIYFQKRFRRGVKEKLPCQMECPKLCGQYNLGQFTSHGSFLYSNFTEPASG